MSKTKPKMIVSDYPTDTPRAVPERAAQLSRVSVTPPSSEPDPEIAAFLQEVADEPQADTSSTVPQAQPTGDEIDLAAIKGRFKAETPEALNDQLAKSYGHVEVALRRKEAELAQLRKALETQVVSQAPQQAPTHTPQRVEVSPWGPLKEKLEKNFLEDVGGSFEAVKNHITAELMDQVRSMVMPVYAETVENRMHREFPGVVTDQSWPIITALARTQEGNGDVEKLRKAVTAYKSMLAPTPIEDPANVEEMKTKAAQPTASGRVGSGKTYSRAWIQQKLQTLRPGTQEYIDFVNRAQTAYQQGRVTR